MNGLPSSLFASRRTHTIEVSAPFGCITRIDCKSAALSYPILTPSAARGMVSKIHWKPEMVWQVEAIEMLAQPRYMSIVQNQVKKPVPVEAVTKAMKTGELRAVVTDWGRSDREAPGFMSGEYGRVQRSMTMLLDAKFRITARALVRVTRDMPHRQKVGLVIKHDEMFERRGLADTCHEDMYMGSQEFLLDGWRYVPNGATRDAPIPYDEELPMMLYDTFEFYLPGGKEGTSLFNGKIEQGVMKVPSYLSSEVLKTPATLARLAAMQGA